MDIVQAVRDAGVVGAGGAGFPTHVKLGAQVDYVLANGAECEPLLHKDAELTEAYVGQVIRGMQLSMEATGAPEAIFGIKEKRKKTIEVLEQGIGTIGPVVTLAVPAFDLHLTTGDPAAALRLCDELPPFLAGTPNWRLRRADALVALGRRDDALAELTAATAAIERLPARRRNTTAMLKLQAEITRARNALTGN